MTAPAAPTPDPVAPATAPASLAEATAAARQSLQQQIEGDAIEKGAAKPGEGPNVTGNPPPDPAGTPNGGESPPAPAGAPPEGAPDGQGPEDQGGEQPEALVVELPGATDGEVVQLEVPDEETKAQLQRLRDGFMQSEELRATEQRVQQTQAQLAEAEEVIQTDPVGYVLGNLPTAMQDEIALHLLGNPAVWERIGATVEKMLDPDQRELISAKLEARRYQMQDTLRTQRSQRIATEQNAREVFQFVQALVPEGFEDGKRRQFVSDAMRDLGQFAEQTGRATVAPEMVPTLLASRMAAYGLNPVERAAAAAKSRQNGHSLPARAPDGRFVPSPQSPSATAPAAPAPKRVTAKTFVEGQKRREAVAGVAPAGAGAPPLTLEGPPPGANLAEASAFLRKQRAGA